jgi:hypothetical protein
MIRTKIGQNQILVCHGSRAKFMPLWHRVSGVEPHAPKKQDLGAARSALVVRAGIGPC